MIISRNNRPAGVTAATGKLLANPNRSIRHLEEVLLERSENDGITETTARVYYKVWEMACFGGFLMGRARLRKAWRVSSGRKAFMWPIRWSTAPSTVSH